MKKWQIQILEMTKNEPYKLLNYMKKKLVIAFSGGETSAFMAQWILKNRQDEYDIVCVFANTGQENDETLEFVEKCDKTFNLNLVWVEAIINPEHGKGVRHKIVNFDSASRNGEPFEDLIAKLGMVNQAAPFCTRDLKLGPIKSYLKSIGWKDYITAIGVRQDEIDRVNPNYKENRIYYPLVSDMPMSKPKINFWWNQQPFRLNLKGYQGNCKWCYKKSTNKLLTICVENPEYFDFPKRMEEKYENFIPISRKQNESLKVPIRFFRGNRSVNDLFELSKLPFKKSKDDATVYSWQQSIFDDQLDATNGCDESCEVY